MVLDSICVQNFHYLTVALVKVLSFFGVNMSSSVHIDNKNKDILLLGKGPAQRLDDTTLTAEAKYPFLKIKQKILLKLGSIMRAIVFLSVNATKIFQFKARGSEIKKYPLCLGNISKDFSANKIKKTNFPPLRSLYARKYCCHCCFLYACLCFCWLVLVNLRFCRLKIFS